MLISLNAKKNILEKFLHAEIAQQEKKTHRINLKSAKEKIQSSFSNTHMSNEAIELFSMPHRVYGSIPKYIKY